MTRVASGEHSLSHRDTRFVKAMLNRGDRQHDIAAYFGVNGGRIAEVSTGDGAWPNAQPWDEHDLPPPGPYVTKYALRSVVSSLNEAIEAIEMAEAENQLENIQAALQLAKSSLQAKINQLEPA